MFHSFSSIPLFSPFESGWVRRCTPVGILNDANANFFFVVRAEYRPHLEEESGQNWSEASIP